MRITRRGTPGVLPPRRAAIVLVAYLLVFVSVGYRLVGVQVVRAREYAAIGEQQRARTIELPAQRGRIYDRNGGVLATSVESATIYADPRAYRPRTRDDGLMVPPAADAFDVAAKLAPLLGVPAPSIEEKLRRDAHFVYLARQVDRGVGQRIRELALPGIGVLSEPSRVYPAGPLAAQVVGFAGIDGEGLAGLELQYDHLLAGKPGQLALEAAPDGLPIASAERRLLPPTAGTDLVLTIDREIQHVAERAAADAVTRNRAKGATVVVMEVGTGDVLAMASAPVFDPNHVDGSPVANRRNRAVTDMFEPGSVQKAVTVSAILEEGVASPETVLDVADKTKVEGWTFSDAHPHTTRQMSLREVFAESSNVGTIQWALRLGAPRLARYLTAFGYGQALGLGFPGEGSGSLLPLEDWSNSSLPTIAIGHGVAMTLLQAVTIYAALANDGVEVMPRLLHGTVGADGRLVSEPPAQSHRVISEHTARLVRDMMTAVVTEEDGTGRLAAIPGYTVGGKTGTAKKPLEGARGYSDQYIASFVGIAPVEAPRFVVGVMIDEPWEIYGGVVAAPVFSEVMSFALAHLRIPPSDPVAAARAVTATPPGGGAPPDPAAAAEMTPEASPGGAAPTG